MQTKHVKINVVAFAANRSVPPGSIEIPLSKWVELATQEELLKQFEGWGPDVRILLEHMPKPTKWSIHGLDPPLESYVHQRVVLVGDSVGSQIFQIFYNPQSRKAHAMQPHLGAGVGQGFEDVLILCELLGHERTTKANLQVQIYLVVHFFKN